MIYVNKIENRITFKTKTEYFLKLLMPAAMKWLPSPKSNLNKDKNGKNVPYLEIAEVVSINCNIINNHYQQNSRVFYTFIPNKPFCQLLHISPKIFIFFKTFDSEFSYIEVWFTGPNSKLLKIEDKKTVL